MYGERLRLNPLVCFVSWYLIFIADFCLLMLLVIQDTIHTVYYAWAMLQVPPEELGEGAIYPIWRLREMQQFGVQALI